jgi:hypothetical protein
MAFWNRKGKDKEDKEDEYNKAEKGQGRGGTWRQKRCGGIFTLWRNG